MKADSSDVKQQPAVTVKVTLRRRCLNWIEGHPRTGWYVTALLALNFLLDFIYRYNLDLWPF